MTVASDLQSMVANVSAAIAGSEIYGRAELEILRRNLAAIAKDAGEAERADFATRHMLDEVCAAVETGVLDLSGVARRGRAQIAELG